MALKYRDDPDLDFLAYVDHEGLSALAGYMTHDTDGEKRFAEELLSDEAFKANQEDLTKAWRLIAAELQGFGGDTVVNRIRGTGVPYREMLDDVCSRVGVPSKAATTVMAREDQLIAELLRRFFERATQIQINEILEAASEGAGRLKRLNQEELLALVGTDPKISLVVAQFVANAIGRVLLVGAAGAALAGVLNAAVARAALAVVPLINLVLGPLAISMATGPAYRVTVPSVVHIAYLRRLALAPRYKAKRP